MAQCNLQEYLQSTNAASEVTLAPLSSPTCALAKAQAVVGFALQSQALGITLSYKRRMTQYHASPFKVPSDASAQMGVS